MTPEQAAWVRATAWPVPIRRDYGPWVHRCACQHGPTSACHTGDHDRCHQPPGWAADLAETVITDAHGAAVAPAPCTGITVRVTGCCGRWRCTCDCHTRTPGPVQLSLLETA